MEPAATSQTPSRTVTQPALPGAPAAPAVEQPKAGAETKARATGAETKARATGAETKARATGAETKARATGAETKARATGAMAWLMDEVIPIPGTKIKIGLDPLLGAIDPIFPVGEVVSNGVSMIALVEALRRGLPFKSMMTIVGNILVNAGFGSVPVIGNIFSVLFRSNSRNRDVINEHLRTAIETGEPASWWRVVPVLVFLVVFVLGALTLNMLLWAFLATLLLKNLGWELPSLDLHLGN